jgi:peptide/nickel transport system permease protein
MFKRGEFMKVKYITKRVLQVVPMLIIVSIVAFTLSNLSAGNTAQITIINEGEQVNSDTVRAVNRELGLDKPLYVQYFRWLGKVCNLDLGVSYRSKQPVLEEIMSRFPATLKLALCAALLSVAIALLMAVVSVRYRNKWIDHFLRIISTAGITVPDFWLGLLLLYFFAIYLNVFPVVAGDRIQNIFLPAFTLSIGYAAVYTRLLRSNLLEIIDCDYMKAARAKGLSESAVIIKHGLKNAVIPCMTLIGSNFGSLVAGNFICETIFSWNGIGKYAVESIKAKDFPVIQGYMLVVAVSFIILNLIIDICYIYVDPKIRLE